MSKIMDARSKVGFILHKCCCQNAITTLTILVGIMSITPFSSTFSTVLEASISYCLQYVSVQDRDQITKYYSEVFRKHINSDESDHLSNLSQFLQSGGCKLIPQPNILLQDLLNLSSKIGNAVFKPAGFLIDYKPEIMSQIFWEWFNANKTISNGLTSISEVIIYSKNLLIPNCSNDFIKSIIKECENRIDNNLPFNVIETSLLILKWLTSLEKYEPFKIFPSFDHNALNGLALDCWAEYAVYGNLTNLPNFQISTEQTFEKGYLQILSNAVMNPKFSFKTLRIPHWVWHSCLSEFGFPSEIPPKSILSLSLIELDCCIKIAHILPREFFIHAMRSRSKNPDITSRLIQIVSYTPQCIMQTYFSDFEDFVTFILDHHSLSKELSSCFRNNIIAIRDSLHILINHICSGLDYFKEEKILGRLFLLNQIFVFSHDLICYIDIYDSIWEALSLIPLSLSLSLVLFDFFNALAKFVNKDRQKRLSKLCVAVLSAVNSNNEIPLLIVNDDIAMKFFFSAKEFYSFINSDLISDPDYNIQKTYVLSSPALKILKQIYKTKEILDYIFYNLPNFLEICPTETTALATELIDDCFYEYKKEYLRFCTNLSKIMKQNSCTPLVMLISYFQTKISVYLDYKFDVLLKSNIMKLPDDENLVRLNIQLNHGIVPMLVSSSKHLFLMLENWAPPTSDVFLNVVSKESQKEQNWIDERFMRYFLMAFGYHQPKKDQLNWLTREFQKSFSLKFDTEKIEGKSDILTEFSKFYPLPNNYNALSIASMYCNSPKVYPFLVNFLSPICNNLVEENPNEFWLLRLLGHLNIKYKFPVDSKDKFCRALGVRNRCIPAPNPQNAGDGFLAVETLTAYNSKMEKEKTNDLLKLLKSQMLRLKFGLRGSEVTEKFLRKLMKSDTISQKINFFFHLSTFAEITSNPVLLEKNKSVTCQMILNSDMKSPIVFREIFLLIVNLVTQSRHSFDSSEICDAFLQAIPKDVKDVQIYESLPILLGIIQIAGINAKGTKEIVESLKHEEFNFVNVQDFQSVRKTIINLC
ncbi:hypothetical protein TVAG_477500 [Trichomonas vaginalis G3]|uniref:Uncharacterized protein n=1 Tax=Trichomonas vaginalis (strain ATCC PRA-98 / G3) TaxID=412133 RepID=A2F9F7_TRIV3|nr:hypothetical protein TVAGG3_1029610 [Trichomonas vaginalis G3]EAX98476.1 hypothetical protein TVAG_477500 [Trichomonas vaginalis G3]KAI5492760.1 hypothetical protein TVAGG3_1029610 [Trichomonas vaginalis G3]|eukprot:XP_001311406.1 hypothetical protein [Trichomonas vaginalis G3]